MIGKVRGHGPFDTYSFVIPKTYVSHTKIKRPIECCDDGAAMVHNHFLFPDH